MPEYAELHGSAQQLNEWAAGHAFSAAEVNLEHTLPHSLGVEVPAGTQLCALPGTAQWARFEMCARHRGKEVCVALRPMAAAATPPSSLPFCPTRAAVFGSTAPLCQHGEPCEVRTSRKAGKNCGRRYWVCPRARHEQCSCFEWLAPTKAECEADRAQRDWFPETSTSPTISTISSREIEAAGVAVDGAAPLAITMRRGMSGRVELHLGSRRGAPSGWHLRFKRDDGAYVYFIDGRTRVNAGAIWNMGVWGGAWRRSADPVYEYDAFRSKILQMLTEAPPLPVALLSTPICELLLDQRLFNGVGNYLRAEILYRAKLPPFTRARDALERAARNPESELDVIAVTRSTLAYAVRHKSQKEAWLDVYGRTYARQELDGCGRTIWYRGERGPLPPTITHANGIEGSCSSIFLGRLSHRLDKEQASLTSLILRLTSLILPSTPIKRPHISAHMSEHISPRHDRLLLLNLTRPAAWALTRLRQARAADIRRTPPLRLCTLRAYRRRRPRAPCAPWRHHPREQRGRNFPTAAAAASRRRAGASRRRSGAERDAGC